MELTAGQIFVADRDLLLCDDPRRFLESMGIDMTGGIDYIITRSVEEPGVVYTRKNSEA